MSAKRFLYGFQTGSLSDTIGNMFMTNGNIGIGTTSPAYTLDVTGTGRFTTGITGANSSFTNITSGNAIINTNLVAMGNSNTIGNVFTTGGNTGISTTSPGYTLDVSGNVNFTGTLTKSGTGYDGNPTGTILMWPTSSAPTGYLLCNGSAISRSTYAALFAVIGTTYGTGDGSTTFNLPDLRGRVPVGTGQGSGLTNRALAATGGEESHTLTTSEMPSHTHTGTTTSVGNHTHTGTTTSVGDHTHSIYMRGNGTNQDTPYHVGGGDNGGSDQYQNTGGAGAHNHTFTTDGGGAHNHTFTTDASGSGGSHNIMQPFVVITFVIKS